MSLAGKRAFVTGGGSGIGLAVAKALAAHDAGVIVAGRDVARLEQTGLPFAQVDVIDESSVKEALKAHGPIDVFVANAGAAATAPALKTPRDMWDEMIAVNLTGVYLCAREAVPPMVERGWGRFIAVASTAALKGYAYAGAYAAAKHGVLGWVRTLALELARTGVTANAVCPGFTDTPLTERAVETVARTTGRSGAEAKEAFTRANPMRRLVRPEEVADAVVWLAGDGAASVNGQAIAVDGGETSA